MTPLEEVVDVTLAVADSDHTAISRSFHRIVQRLQPTKTLLLFNGHLWRNCPVCGGRIKARPDRR